ncbi:MAG: hypothetical protein RR792_05625 [Thermomonas sp.]
MRQVFTSPRLENVEAVAGLLREQGIEVRITNDRSYRGNRRSRFSYRELEGDEAEPQSAVWIVNADEQPRARQLLREAGLLDSSRDGTSSYLPLSALKDAMPDPHAKTKRKMYIKLGLLVAILAVVGVMLYGQPKAPPAASTAATTKPAPTPADIVPQSADELPVYRADVPTALAKLLVEDALATRKPAQVCIGIDGADPSPAQLQSLQAGDTAIFANMACPAGNALRIAVREYMTDGSGSGKVTVQLADEAARTLDVERDGTAWRVLGKR